MAENVFVKCATTNEYSTESSKFQITFNYELLDDQYASWTSEDGSSRTGDSSLYGTYSSIICIALCFVCFYDTQIPFAVFYRNKFHMIRSWTSILLVKSINCGLNSKGIVFS